MTDVLPLFDDEAPAKDIASLREAAEACTRCPLYKNATQTVFGEGPVPATLMLVGEQPGDKEDLAGRPFVGPAGAILDRALEQAGIERDTVYVTNAVKHFKNEPRGKRRLHKRPNQYEIGRCKWWLDQEIALVHPRYIVALGATAALALSGKHLTIAAQRGVPIAFSNIMGAVTMHPSAILRMRDSESREHAFAGLVEDLKAVRQAVAKLPTPSGSHRPRKPAHPHA